MAGEGLEHGNGAGAERGALGRCRPVGQRVHREAAQSDKVIELLDAAYSRLVAVARQIDAFEEAVRKEGVPAADY